MAEDDLKTEEPTPKKLEKTREEGQFARSQDLSVALLTISVACVIYLLGGGMGASIVAILQDAFAFDERVIRDTALVPSLFGELTLRGFLSISPIFATTIFLAFGAAFLVGGIGFSIKGFFPKASKLNPLKGLARMFGLKSLVELGKGVLKLAVIGSMVTLVIFLYYEEIFSLPTLDSYVATGEGLLILAIGVVMISVSLLIIAAVDVPYQVISFKNKLKMSIQEIKDEYKDTEGRPEVRQRIREKQREIAMASTLDAVSKADVIVTNPSHFAVALSYAVGTDEAPKVIAKGADFMAKKIRERAEESGIHIFEEPQLARALFFTTEIDQDIPRLLFEAVAEVIAYVFQLNAFNKDGQTLKKPKVRLPSEMQFDESGKQLDI
ncbi:MAG: flagellar type III secretion system protein FlhB [Gammaproteobacteria bacterium]|nr:flagellar type III secretion system protein FlhB [Gammaproteobacteria bacterium]